MSLSLNRNGRIAYGLVEVALFVAANATAKSSGHPGTVSQIFFVMFVAGLLLAILILAVNVARNRRATN